MKKILLVFLISLALCGMSYADGTNPYVIGGGVSAGGGGCDDCSGATTFAWHMEHITDVEDGTPCGCSDGATTGSALGGATISDVQKQDGTYSLLSGSDDSVSFAATSIFNLAGEGTVSMYIYVADWTANTSFTEYFGARYDADNFLSFNSNYDGSNTDFFFRIEGSNDWDQQALANKDTSGINATWIRVMFSWDINEDAVDSFFFWVDLNADGDIDVGESGSSTTRTVGNMTAPTTFEIGDADVYATGDDVSYIDNVYITNTYQDSL